MQGSERGEGHVMERRSVLANDGLIGHDPTFEGADSDHSDRRAWLPPVAQVAYQRRTRGPKIIMDQVSRWTHPALGEGHPALGHQTHLDLPRRDDMTRRDLTSGSP